MTDPVVVRFRAEAPGEVCAWMRRLADGGGWVNLVPVVTEADLPPARSPLAALVTARGPDVPVATWVPARAGRRRREPVTVGIQHAAGPKAARLLGERGLEVPVGWRVVQDHPRRGLAVEIPDGVAPEEVLRWLLAAAAALSVVPVTGWWDAMIHESGA